MPPTEPGPTVYVDFDDVLAHTARAITQVVRARFGKDVSFESLHHFDIGGSFGLTGPQLDEVMAVLHEPAMLETMDPVEDAVRGLGLWRERGCRIAVVTGRPPASRHASARWLRNHGVPHDELFFVDKYGRGHGKESGPHSITVSEILEMSFCIAVEDSSDMADVLFRRTSVPIALLDRPWNRGRCAEGEEKGRIVRCRDWQDVLQRFPDVGLPG